MRIKKFKLTSFMHYLICKEKTVRNLHTSNNKQRLTNDAKGKRKTCKIYIPLIVIQLFLYFSSIQKRYILTSRRVMC